MRYPADWLEDLRMRADILSVVSEYVQLKPKGRSYWGLCPFHGEKTASFKVDPDHGLYYCFGCKAGGTVFDFVMGMERMEFTEAVRYLADKFHVPLPDAPDDGREEERRTLRENILRLNREAAMFYHKTLYTPEGAQSLAYLHGRGLDDRTIRLFGIGASPNSWDALTKHLQEQGASIDLLAQAGLTVKKENNRAFDMFRNRAMFPIIDARGSVLGFGGRALGDVQPKYLNTADTPAFNKRHNVYAANLLRKTKNLKRVLLVEGYMDVVSLISHGVEGAAATLGTSLTEEQARLLSRYAPEIWAAYDGDSAGQNAILRAIGIFDAAGIPCRVLVIPGGQDPDEFIRDHGKEAFEALKPMSGVMYRMLRARDGLDLSDEEGRAKYAMACAEILRGVKQPVELENLLKRLSVETGYSREVLLQQIGIAPAKEAQQPRREAPQPIRPIARQEANAGSRAERTLLELMCSGLIPPDTVGEDKFEDRDNRWLAQQLLAGQKPDALLTATEDEAKRRLLLEILSSEVKIPQDEAMQMAAECLESMRREWIEKRIAAIKAEMPGAAPERKESLLREIMMLTNEKKSLGPGRKE